MNHELAITDLQTTIGLMRWSPLVSDWSLGVGKVFVRTIVFVLLFACAALLFRRAGRKAFMNLDS